MLDLIPPTLQPSVQSAALHNTFRLPRALKRAIAGKPVIIDGQELALDAQLLLRLQQLGGRTQLSAATVELARRGMDQANASVVKQPLNGVGISERRIRTRAGNLDARLYRPLDHPAPKLMVFYHGGGWVLGNLDSHDDFCRFLAKHAGIRVLSVNYRLSPEHKFPAALEDAIDAYKFAVENAESLGTCSIAVGGDSAGGNLAASVSLHAEEHGVPKPAFQFLLYPPADVTTRRRSRELFGDGFLLSDEDLDWFIDHHADLEHRKDPRLSILLAEDLRGVPPAYVVTAGFDPLRDDGEEYARRMEEAGVPVVTRRFNDLIHGFINLRLPGSRFEDAMFEIVGGLRSALSLRA